MSDPTVFRSFESAVQAVQWLGLMDIRDDLLGTLERLKTAENTSVQPAETLSLSATKAASEEKVRELLPELRTILKGLEEEVQSEKSIRKGLDTKVATYWSEVSAFSNDNAEDTNHPASEFPNMWEEIEEEKTNSLNREVELERVGGVVQNQITRLEELFPEKDLSGVVPSADTGTGAPTE